MAEKRAERKLSEKWFLKNMGFSACLDEPRMLSQKLYAMRLNQTDPMWELLAPRAGQEEYLRAKRLDRWLERCRGEWEDVRAIEWDDLPEKALLRPGHLPLEEYCIDKTQRGWKKAARGRAKQWLRTQITLPPCAGIGLHTRKRAERILCAEYIEQTPVVMAYEQHEGKRLCAMCMGGEPRALYWADMPQTLFAPTGERLFQQGPALRLRETAEPGSLGEICAFCARLAAGFAYMHIDLLVMPGDTRFDGLRFFEEDAFLRALPRHIDEELGSLLHIG